MVTSQTRSSASDSTSTGSFQVVHSELNILQLQGDGGCQEEAEGGLPDCNWANGERCWKPDIRDIKHPGRRKDGNWADLQIAERDRKAGQCCSSGWN